ncbi:MAG: hypothetical protein IKI08_04785 [Selenomonadaceae bacterium]|nr:hypothetical protein [Selenomonadaceae bacterium]
MKTKQKPFGEHRRVFAIRNWELGMIRELARKLAANFQLEERGLYDLNLNTIKNYISACDIESTAETFGRRILRLECRKI